MLLSAYGSRWKDIVLANFVLHVDDSGTRPSHKVAVASALVIPAKQICALEREWNTFKAKEGFSFFHASPCNAQEAKSEFANWSDAKVDRVFARVMQIARKYGAFGISCSTHKKIYDEVVKPDELRRYFGTYHYSWCVGLVVAFAERWRRRAHHKEPLEFIFDYMEENDPARIEIQKQMALCERVNKEECGVVGAYTNYSFRVKKDIPGLQCADEIAWACNRYSINLFEKIDLPARAEECWTGYGCDLAEAGFVHAFTVEKPQLEKLVAEEMADGRIFERLRRWEKEDSENKL